MECATMGDRGAGDEFESPITGVFRVINFRLGRGREQPFSLTSI